MGRTAQVLSATHVVDAGGHGVDVVADPGGVRNVTAPQYIAPGVDALALAGDSVALEDSSGTGCEQATGYADTRNAGKTAPGEIRLYARDSNGVVVGDLWLKGDGSIVATNDGGSVAFSPEGVLSVSGSSDAAALASAIDRIGRAISVIPEAVSPADVLAAVNAVVTAFKLSYPPVGLAPSLATAGSELLKVGG
jgi:hypothetical protein